MMFVGFVVASPWALLVTDDLGGVDAKGWLLIALIVLMTGVVGHGLMVWAQRHVQITIASLITLLQPVIGGVGAWIIYDQGLRAVQLVCGAVVLIALAGLAAEARPTPARRAALSAVAE
jgi:drug/metabolite transporter (DMT)-like permease